MASQSPHFPDCFYRVSIKGAYVKGGKILLCKESEKISGKWELPGGGLDFGEDAHTALKREIKEEMGLTVTSVSDAPIYSWTTLFDGRRGMEWYYSCVLLYQIELLDLDFTPSEECLEIASYSVEELQKVQTHVQTEKLKKLFNPADFSS